MLFNLDEHLESQAISATQSLSPTGTPVTVVTGASVTQFNEREFIKTKNKAFFPGNEEWLMNVSLPCALALAERGRRAVVQCCASQFTKLQTLLKSYEHADKIQLLSGDLGEADWLSALDETLKNWGYEEPISRLDFILYESYTTDIQKPFVPTWLENPESIGKSIQRRVAFFQHVSNYCYALLRSGGQPELRVLAITALASFRSVSYLFADSAHKAVSSKFLQTWGIEALEHTKKPVSIVELCPGVVDTGLYDPPHIRQAAWSKASYSGFPFSSGVSAEDLTSWPMLSPWDIAEITRCYLLASFCEDADTLLESEHIRSLMTAGRAGSPSEELPLDVSGELPLDVIGELPLYASYPRYPWGRLPAPHRGYTPVFITPLGQRV